MTIKLPLIDISTEEFISVLNTKLGTSLVHSEIRLTGAAKQGVTNFAEDINNTVVTIAPSATSSYVGESTVEIKAFVGEKLASILGGFVTVTTIATKEEIIEAINQQRGLKIDTDAVATVDWPEGDGNGTITFADGSLFAVRGDMTFRLIKQLPQLSTVLTATDLGELRTNTPNQVMAITGIQLWGVDFTKIASTLDALSTSFTAAAARTIDSSFTSALDTTWTYKNLANRPILYKGTTADFNLANYDTVAVNTNFTNVIVVTMATGVAFLHYNLGA